MPNRILAAAMAGDLSAVKGRFVKLTAGAVVLCDDNLDIAVGVVDHVVPGTQNVGIALKGAQTEVLVDGAVKRLALGTIDTSNATTQYDGTADTQKLCQFLADGADGEYVPAVVL
jgi:hypothetical protein